MDCIHCDGLYAEYVRLGGLYSEAVRTLHGKTSISATDYSQLRKAAQEARLDTEFVRLELVTHKRRHSVAAQDAA